MLELARRGLVHVLGSDSHSAAHGRPLRLSGAVERLREVEPVRSNLEWMVERAPRAIVRGRAGPSAFRPC